MKRILSLLLVALPVGLLLTPDASAQQRIGYIDSQYILDNTPEYTSVQRQIDQMAQEWENELEQRRGEVDALFQDYQARDLLYTSDERERKREEIIRAEEELENLRMQYFGPEGELFTQQRSLMRPIQERILRAVEVVAEEEGYDYVFDKGSELLFMYTREQFNLSDRILQELGIDVDAQTGE